MNFGAARIAFGQRRWTQTTVTAHGGRLVLSSETCSCCGLWRLRIARDLVANGAVSIFCGIRLALTPPSIPA
jgi:hypothetical protein